MATPSEAIQRRFELESKRAAQRAKTQTQEEEDALTRRFAAMGNVQSGSFIKQQQLAKERGAERLEGAEEAISGQRLAEEQRLAEAEEGRTFSRGEREAAQGFAASEAEKGRGFARGEREAGQSFLAQESKLGRKQQESQFEKTFNFSKSQASKQWSEVSRQAGIDAAVTASNLRVQGAPQEYIDAILSAGGMQGVAKKIAENKTKAEEMERQAMALKNQPRDRLPSGVRYNPNTKQYERV